MVVPDLNKCKKIDHFINQYSTSKTLRFRLIPQGKTLENIKTDGVLERDAHRAESYKLVKGYIDNFHRYFIDDVLSGVQALNVQPYAKLYYKKGKTDEDYLISPVRDQNGKFYDSRDYDENSCLPANPAAVGAYNIARKAAWAINVLKTTADEDLFKAKIVISNKEWLAYAQNR